MALFLRKRRDGTTSVSADRDGKETPPSVHHFAPRWVNQHVLDGTVSLSQGKVVIHATPGETSDDDVVYEIQRPPGAYCSFCGERIADGPATTAEEAARRRDMVELCDDFVDDGRPHYEVIHYYDAELVS